MVLTDERDLKKRTKYFISRNTQNYNGKEWRGLKAFTSTELRIIIDFTVGC